jgi:hypothetical protein
MGWAELWTGLGQKGHTPRNIFIQYIYHKMLFIWQKNTVQLSSVFAAAPTSHRQTYVWGCAEWMVACSRHADHETVHYFQKFSERRNYLRPRTQHFSCSAAWMWYVGWCRPGFWWKHGVFSVTFWTMLIDSWMGLYFPAPIRFPWRSQKTSGQNLDLQIKQPLATVYACNSDPSCASCMHHDRLTALAG